MDNNKIVEYRDWDVSNSPGWYWVIFYKNDGVMENIEDGPFETKAEALKMLTYYPYILPVEQYDHISLEELKDLDKDPII